MFVIDNEPKKEKQFIQLTVGKIFDVRYKKNINHERLYRIRGAVRFKSVESGVGFPYQEYAIVIP
jgi:hypothetical protein